MVSSEAHGVLPALAIFIAQTVQAALAAEGLNNQASSVANTLPSSSPVSSVTSSLVPVYLVASACSGGITPSLSSLGNHFLAAGSGTVGSSQQGRPPSSISMAVPSFVSTFAILSMSSSVSSSPSLCHSQIGVTCNVADRSAVLASPVLDQLFVVGAGFSPVLAKIASQIVAGK